MIKIIKISDPKKDIKKQIRENTWSKDISNNVKAIIEKIRKEGDKGLLECIEKYDGVKLDSIKVTESEVREAYRLVSVKQVKAIKIMKTRLEKTEKSIINSINKIKIVSEDVTINKKIVPINRVGCYVPGGQARYPTTLVMCSIPAKIAGVDQIVAISPPMKNGNIDPLTLVAADICGVCEFYKVGGAHGIAALSYGTETIKGVNKIVGPGGIYVSIAKSIISKDVSIDMIAGPTELLIYANEETNPEFAALDLISQSEHSKDTVCGVVTKSQKVANKIANEVKKAINSNNISRKEIVEKSISENGFIALCKNDEKIIEFINEFAPEHLELLTDKETDIIKKITNAGLILTGNYSPSSVSDYCIGSNHVLPTNGFAKSRSSLSVLDFIKLINIVKINKSSLAVIDPILKELTTAEGLINHYEAAHRRIRNGLDN